MKSTFSRTFFPAALLLLAALLLVGASFQILVKNYLVNESYTDLEGDGTVIADTVYTAAGPFSEGIGIVHQGNDWYFLDENGVKVF